MTQAVRMKAVQVKTVQTMTVRIQQAEAEDNRIARTRW